MALLVADCPRCGASKITFDVQSQVYRGDFSGPYARYEIFCVCRACDCPTIFLVRHNVPNMDGRVRQDEDLVLSPSALNQRFSIERFISLRDTITQKPPEHLPEDIEKAFMEGAACLSIGCYNAAAAMFRLCVDLVTRPLLPDPTDTARIQPPNNRTRRDLSLRLAWLFDNGLLPSALKELARCIREDGNDGAHAGNLTQEDAEDVLDFTTALLERLITEPKKLELAEQRRVARRSP
jgi:hypothetical protein